MRLRSFWEKQTETPRSPYKAFGMAAQSPPKVLLPFWMGLKPPLGLLIQFLHSLGELWRDGDHFSSRVYRINLSLNQPLMKQSRKAFM
jgi:hypothetical protein